MKQMFLKYRKKDVLLLFALLICCVPMGISKEEKPKTKDTNFEEEIYDWSGTFAEVLSITGEKHYKVENPDKCMIHAIDAFLTCIDPHSGFLDPETYKNLLQSTSGEFYGVGIVIDNTRQKKDKYLTIIDTIPDGPSDKAGVQPYDKIIEIDGDLIEGMSTDQATIKLKGERNTKVHIKVLRENYPDIIGFDITRDIIKEKNSLGFYIKNEDVYYLALTMFTENSVKQIEELLKKATEKDSKGIVLDLRNNSGGLLTAAVDIVGLFTDKESLVVTTKDKNNKETERYVTTRQPVITKNTVPIFIMTNNYTASAAEILAGCLKIYSQQKAQQAGKGNQKELMVFIVGTQTFGKGSVQEIIPVSHNCAIKLTTTLYFLPDGSTIQGTGITPDFIIEKKYPPSEQAKWFATNFGRERAQTHYIKPHGSHDKEKKEEEENKKKKKEDKDKKETWSARAKKMLEKDNQLHETLTIINMIHNAEKTCAQNVRTREEIIKYVQSIRTTETSLILEDVKL